MLLGKTIYKTKTLFQKTLENLQYIFFGGYQKLSKPASFSPFSRRSGKRKDHQRDQFYTNFCDEWEANLCKAKESYDNSIMASKDPKKEEDACGGSFMKFAKQSPVDSIEEGVVKEKNKESPQIEKGEESCSKKMNGACQGLAQKKKDLEMMGVGDVEQVLDIEEALHYYSRLTSPVYLDIVDKFFTDMYTEFSAPHASASINNSKRLDSISV
ncbi:uncharacterized protein LOC115992337 [Quercus lobata]|uniref:Uncharacterized protein n=1 Tax=Quercus lobata TaxID=97700 RepID=A0A7N2LPD6_QUELO|nr:uncharacterized protein LOC115992337 [Quercus lobata]